MHGALALFLVCKGIISWLANEKDREVAGQSAADHAVHLKWACLSEIVEAVGAEHFLQG